MTKRFNNTMRDEDAIKHARHETDFTRPAGYIIYKKEIL